MFDYTIEDILYHGCQNDWFHGKHQNTLYYANNDILSTWNMIDGKRNKVAVVRLQDAQRAIQNVTLFRQIPAISVDYYIKKLHQSADDEVEASVKKTFQKEYSRLERKTVSYYEHL